MQSTQETVETLFSRCKLAIELHDVDGLFQCLGLPGHPPRHALIRALSDLQESRCKPDTARRCLLAGSLLFTFIPEVDRATCAELLLELQGSYYLQRVIDLLQSDQAYGPSVATVA